MNTVKLVAVFAENRPGQAARITEILFRAGINIRCITVASSGAFGVMKLLVNDPALACRSLQKEGIAATLMDVLAVEMPDQPGALHTVAACLAAHQINLSNTSGFVANQRAILIIEVEDPTQAGEVLLKQGLRVLTQKEALAV
ncbi:MAG TPA: ACT domain-containing protein [Candidatus Acidoferrum sp.]|nr:ACT domain-containing protein [Candidatus Acidoferrum sp.]